MDQILGPFGALVIAALWLLLVGCSLALPLVVWSITRNIRGIRRQLERLNDTLDGRAGAGGASAAAATFAPATRGDTRTATARPGALGI